MGLLGVRNGWMHPPLEQYIKKTALNITSLSDDRTSVLEDVARFVSSKRVAGEPAMLNFICTHNSRRSQMAQLWAAAAAAYFGIEGVQAYSGGTEATAFNPRAVATMERAGFIVDNPGGDNPHYLVSYSEGGPAIECFSKTYDDPFNPSGGFAAIMTCSDADAACPVVLGAAERFAVRYEDPKAFDDTPREAAAYDERCLQIAAEMLYLFSRVT